MSDATSKRQTKKDAQRLRESMGYEASVPRCANCTNFRPPFIKLTTHSMTKRVSAVCKLGSFNVDPVGCCDRWQSAKGEVLETEEKDAA